MKIKYGLVFVALAVTACCHIVASGNGLTKTHYAITPHIMLNDVLPPPPMQGSLAAQDDLETVLKTQAKRTAAQIASAQADNEISIFRFQSVLGAKFAPNNLPYTVNFFQHVLGDQKQIISLAKDYYHRPRPYTVSDKVTVIVERPGNRSYPSGHTAFAYMTGIILANMVPEKREEIFARAEAYAQNRVIGGVHFPSDIVAGRMAATVIVSNLMQDPLFQAEFTKAKAEMRRVLFTSPVTK